ncbi:MAG: hypothetical protein DMG96_30300 [Acidobacteria bacterium]|nr:MAG: hypothetical protein DMG98_19865 [Acidobacteriota bacterium]PYV70795.1 MAG: hypothetical protein DMG96_30300 [Acidobacteriota bacterium]
MAFDAGLAIFLSPTNCERASGRLGAVVAVNSRNACGSQFLFFTRGCCPHLHALFVLWVVFGAFVTRSRPVVRWLHIGSLIWGILTELLPWPCPLTVLENWLEGKAGVEPYQGGFLLLADLVAFFRRPAANLFLNRVQGPDPFQCFRRRGRGVRLL